MRWGSHSSQDKGTVVGRKKRCLSMTVVLSLWVKTPLEVKQTFHRDEGHLRPL